MKGLNFEGQHPDPLLAAAAGARREIGSHPVQGSEQAGHDHTITSISERGWTPSARMMSDPTSSSWKEVVVTNGNGKHITASIEGGEAEVNMKIIVFAHPGEGEVRNILEVNYSPSWATTIEEGLDTILSNAEISVDQGYQSYFDLRWEFRNQGNRTSDDSS